MARRPQWWHRLQASKGEVRLAVDLYNRSGHERHLEAFIIHMTLGWLRLLQARIEQRGGDLYERDKHGMAEEAPRRRLGLQTAADPARRGLQGQRSDPGQHHLLHRAPEPNRIPTRVTDRDPRRRQNQALLINRVQPGRLLRGKARSVSRRGRELIVNSVRGRVPECAGHSSGSHSVSHSAPSSRTSRSRAVLLGRQVPPDSCG
ncbi:MAG: hypothetical protein K0S98_1827 [Propionibacteriaceae bacterium]|nr:hypothetical protein [Propionibacteriaceae bacterium]